MTSDDEEQGRPQGGRRSSEGNPCATLDGGTVANTRAQSEPQMHHSLARGIALRESPLISTSNSSEANKSDNSVTEGSGSNDDARHSDSDNDSITSSSGSPTRQQPSRGRRGRGRRHLRGILRLLLRTHERDIATTTTTPTTWPATTTATTAADACPVYRTRKVSLTGFGAIRSHWDAIPTLRDLHWAPRAVLRLAGHRRPLPRGLLKLPQELVRLLVTFVHTADCFSLQQTCRWNREHFAAEELWRFLYRRDGLRRRHLRLTFTQDYALWLQAKRRVDIAWDRLKRFLPRTARAWSLNGRSAPPDALRELEHVVWLHMRSKDPLHTRSHLPLELAASLVAENGESELGMFFGVAVWRLLSAQEIISALRAFTFWGWPYSRVASPPTEFDVASQVHPAASTADAVAATVAGDSRVQSSSNQLGVLIPAVSLSQQVGFEFVCVDSLSGRVYQYNSSTTSAVFISQSWARYLQVN